MATDKMKVLCMRARLQPKRREPKNLKELLNSKKGSTEHEYVSGHGVCEYMGAIHSSQHTVPDAQHDSTRCCPTHEMWELPTPLIVANRSQQGDEVRELPTQPQQHPACYYQHNTSKQITAQKHTRQHISQHTVPDAQHDSTRCCPTHEMWELPTPLIVANRSQQGDEVRELPTQPQQHPGTHREQQQQQVKLNRI
ncbi:hypothetical protein F511_17853 [Dorcoceras hygrometricum]|uniref:Uncharacterized protein n=1 Tax=Dorcoceras hygrometricum TaxID=472368 RepID=A0A2Z7C614_9LAMI|nr:hypothetical protein F511_17853 [Dorcoceras hygrometricum]